MTITRAPGDDNSKPMLRITNSFLLKADFPIGSKFEVKYGKRMITITRLAVQGEPGSVSK